MPNRSQRRRVVPRTRSASDKQTHKLKPQTCVVWVPDALGYVANLGPGIFQISSGPELAYHLTEEEAESLALALHLQLGVRGLIRPYFGAQHAENGADLRSHPDGNHGDNLRSIPK